MSSQPKVTDIFRAQAVDGAATIKSDIFRMTRGSVFSLHNQWTGTLTGTFLLYRSNIIGATKDIAKDWALVPSSELDFTSAGQDADPKGGAPAVETIETFVNIGNSAAEQYLLVYANTIGTGVMKCFTSVAREA